MKFAIAAVALLALSASGDVNKNFNISPGAQFEVPAANGQSVQVTPFEVTIGGEVRATPLTVTYYATTLRDTFIAAYTFCTSRNWNLPSPKSEEEQRALVAIMSDNQFGNTWLGGVCVNERWVWMSENTVVSYNNWNYNNGLVGPTPPCRNTNETMFIYGASNGIISRTHKWYRDENLKIKFVICQA